MTTPPKTTASATPQAAELRRLAEEKFRAAPQVPEDVAALSPEQTQRTLHELRVHQIELEMQNEELRQMQTQLNAARARYFDLYDLAPVGYVTLSEQGLILEANLTAATLLGATRGALVQQSLARFIHKDDQIIYYQHRKALFEKGPPHACELRMLNKDGTAFWAQLTANAAPGPSTSSGQAADGAPVCRIALSDITARKQAEQENMKQLDELRRWYAATLGREGRIGELKREVNALAARMGEPPPYGTQQK